MEYQLKIFLRCLKGSWCFLDDNLEEVATDYSSSELTVYCISEVEILSNHYLATENEKRN